MKYGINTLDDFDFKSKKVLARFDLNSPYNREKNTFKSIKRIEAAIPTIKELIEKKARLVLLSHQGGDLEYHNFISTGLHSEVISDLIGKKVKFLDDVCGPAARQAIEDLGEAEVLLLDNVRYIAEEMTLFETKLKLSAQQQAKTYAVKKLAPHGDIYVCDAFAAAHRDQPTLVGFEELLPSCMGRLFEKEYEILSKIMTSPDKPAIFVLGGAKIEDAFNMMPEVLSRGITDEILVSGLLAHVFCMARDMSLGEETEKVIYAKKLDEYIDDAKKIFNEYGDKIVMPIDYAYLDSGGKRAEISAEDLPSGSAIEDIGSETINLYKKKIDSSKTVFINGPAGVFENKEMEPGTKELLTHIAESDVFSVIGGGDSISAVGKYGLAEGFSYMCTGGGAMVRFLSGEELPVVAALKRSAERFK
jgi:phosphoglycerate kinase